MICPLCRQYYDGVEIPKELWNNLDDEWCPKCVSDGYERDMARHRRQHILNRLQLIEDALPNSTNPAKLRLERSELDGKLEKIKEATG